MRKITRKFAHIKKGRDDDKRVGLGEKVLTQFWTRFVKISHKFGDNFLARCHHIWIFVTTFGDTVSTQAYHQIFIGILPSAVTSDYVVEHFSSAIMTWSGYNFPTLARFFFSVFIVSIQAATENEYFWLISCCFVFVRFKVTFSDACLFSENAMKYW